MNIFRLSGSELSDLAARLSLPYLVRCRESVAAANELLGAARVRRYQHAITAGGALQVVSPVSGNVVASGSALAMPCWPGTFRSIFCFPEDTNVFAIAADLSLGMPIAAIVLPNIPVLLKTVNSPWSIDDSDLPGLLEFISQFQKSLGPARQPPTLLVGHENFAHYAWNQLSGLDQLLAGSPGLGIVETKRPFGDIGCNLPACDRLGVVQPEEIVALNEPGNVMMMVGSLRVTRSLSDRLLNAFANEISTKSINIIDKLGEGPVLWQNVRTRNRVALNQVDALTAVADEFLRLNPRGSVILDGFSIACDPTPESDIVAQSDLAAANAIAAKIAHKNVHVAAGFSIIDSINLAGYADFYFSGHGTLQHKIGWFHAVPGIVHSNADILSQQGISAWVGDQSEVALEPIYLPPSHVSDGGLSDGAYSSIQHLIPQADYVFSDIDATLGFFRENAAAHKLF